MNIKEIINEFGFAGEFVGSESFGQGHINDTFALSFIKDGKTTRYVLQCLNHNIFKDIAGLMRNVSLVSSYLRNAIITEGGDPNRECLNFLPCKSGKFYYEDGEGKFWRSYHLVEDCEAYQIASDKNMFSDAGRAFGKFINRLDGFDASALCEVIPNFHNTQDRLRLFQEALDRDFENRSIEAKTEIEFFLKRADYCNKVISKIAVGEIPLRVTHNDTKLNNVLIDNATLKAICVIDLDTIMAGSMLYDFGDAIRSGCNKGLEDEADLSKVGFDIELFKCFTKGFMEGIGKNITKKEVEMLAFGAILMTYECGMRFLTDFLSGDTYFKTKYPTHNLVRCRTQIKMVEDMEKVLTKLNKIVKDNAKV